MIEWFQKTFRPLQAKIVASQGKNRIGESVFEWKNIDFRGAIFAHTAKEFSAGGDAHGIECSHALYSKECFGKKDSIIDASKQYRVIASLEMRGIDGKIDYYKTLLQEWQ